MVRTRSRFASWLGWVAVTCVVAMPGTLVAEVAQPLPKFPQLPAPKAAPPAEPAKPEAPKAESAQPAAPAAAPGGDRDPFDPLVTKLPPGEEGRGAQIASLKLVGIVWDPVKRDQIRALVETPDGLGYYLRLNEDKFGGKVVAIERDRVKFSVREQIPGAPVRTRTVELRLGSGQ